MKFYIPQKPVKWGFKIHVLAESDSGYALNAIMDKKEYNEEITQEPFTFNLINTLMPTSYIGKNYILFIDSWYSSLPIIKSLMKKKIFTVGAIKKNRKYMPKYMEIANSHYIFTSNEWITVSNWTDKKHIVLASSISNCDIIIHKDKKIPRLFYEYNNHMRGVDILDQKASYYQNKNTTKKWWKRVFYHLLEISICNSHILFEKITGRKLSGLEFRKELVCELYKGYQIKSYISNSNLPLISLLTLHTIIKDKSKHNKRCKFCKIKTSWLCSFCNINLCPQCHLSYHVTNGLV